ncbi:hypothetical protein [Acinetobacter ihumii]|uniref:hypothetical protein n=1 Tax=Acinetobacter ihumii TaxID=2483802 RepID=UPI001032203D|nr:hypothetical protein [Acinetobacter ihumii]
MSIKTNRMKNLWMVSFSALLTALSNVPTHAQDIFMGTIVVKEQNFYLKRCTMGADEYLIQSDHPEIFKQLQQLNQNYTKYWLSLAATVSLDDENNLKLDVKEILDVHPERSCHLNEALDDLSQLDTTEN